jgi:hypothetical protein
MSMPHNSTVHPMLANAGRSNHEGGKPELTYAVSEGASRTWTIVGSASSTC